MLTVADIFTATQIAALAWFWSCVLLAPSHILGRLGDWLDTLPRWIAKPLGGCEVCFAGQFAFWFWVANHFADTGKMIAAPFFIAVTVLLTAFFKKTMQK